MLEYENSLANIKMGKFGQQGILNLDARDEAF